MRRTEALTPSRIALKDPVDELRKYLGREIDIRAPHEAEEPILAQPVRAAVFAWLAELRAADELAAAGLKPRATAMLYGPPGCGKTTLAHHLAGRLGVPLVMLTPEVIFSKYMGEAESKTARFFSGLELAATPCVVLMDEMEALGGSRSLNRSGGADNARTSTLGVLLRKVEEFSGILIGATNRQEDLDPALWRRFGIHLQVELPDEDARWAILKRYGLPFGFGDELLDILTVQTAGAAPSLLRQLMEGVKRDLVLGARAGGQPARSAAEAFGRVVAAVRPAPQYDPPLLWTSGLEMVDLAEQPWPPPREAA